MSVCGHACARAACISIYVLAAGSDEITALEQTAYAVLNASELADLAVNLGVRASLGKLGLADAASLNPQDYAAAPPDINVVQTAKLMKLGCVSWRCANVLIVYTVPM